VLDKITGAAANDHLQDVDEGDGTYLNTKEWKFASFFNRVKQSVSQQWNPANSCGCATRPATSTAGETATPCWR